VISPRASAFALLAAANLLWSGNWILGRALRETFDPVALNFWRWLVALAILAPFALRETIAKRAVIRRHAGLLAFLALAGVTVFQSLVYLGLETTTAINAVLINASAPAFIVVCSWIVDPTMAPVFASIRHSNRTPFAVAAGSTPCSVSRITEASSKVCMSRRSFPELMRDTSNRSAINCA